MTHCNWNHISLGIAGNRFRPLLLAATAIILFQGIPRLRAQVDPPYSLNQGGNPVGIVFSNQTGTNVAAYWVNFQGGYQPIGFLLPNQAVRINTYPGHLTAFIANNQIVGRFRATAANQAAYAIVGSGNGLSGLFRQSSTNAALTNLLSAAVVNAATQNKNTGLLNHSTTANNHSSLSNILAALGNGTNTSSNSILNNPVSTRNSNSGLGNLLSSLANGFLPRRNTNTNTANNATGTNANSNLNSIINALTSGTGVPNNNRTATGTTGTNTGNSSQQNATTTTITSTGSRISPQEAQRLVNYHNQKRAEVNVGTVSWDATIAAYAQQRANTIASTQVFAHLPPGQNPYGENLGAGGTTRSVSSYDSLSAAADWYSEKVNLSGRVFTAAVAAQQKPIEVGHYTQMVWKSAAGKKIGAGVATYNDGRFNWTVIVCCYDPPGNITSTPPQNIY